MIKNAYNGLRGMAFRLVYGFVNIAFCNDLSMVSSMKSLTAWNSFCSTRLLAWDDPAHMQAPLDLPYFDGYDHAHG
jgi:hypothetical protein